MRSDALVFGTRTYAYLQDSIAQAAGLGLGEVERHQFPDGELYHRIASPVADRDVVLVGGTHTDADTLEFYDLACGLVQEGAHKLVLAIPYFGYATMERKGKAGEVVTAKTRARLLSSIPVPGSGSRVLLLDLHSEGVPYYFEGALRPFHLRGTPLVLNAARQLAGERPMVVACTDAGRAKWVESLANKLGVRASFVFKRRLGGETTEVTAVSAQVQGAHVVIYDDMIRTGGSLLGAARAYQAAGAAGISVITTHGLFCGDALERLQGSGLFDAIVCTDSHPRARQLANGFLRVESVAPIFAEHLKEAR
ncbi:MAG: ribose-phosphate pyrophosphokinase [Deltaproteobacteria bacterium]|nr:ribose-phosphate pyrophosphokinase [Deltaproteobacteria bacterium]